MEISHVRKKHLKSLEYWLLEWDRNGRSYGEEAMRALLAEVMPEIRLLIENSDLRVENND